jgi:F0F1-type ATP synthase assembly protein I
MDNAAWIISSRLIAGLILYTGLGFLVSLWLGNRPLFMALGALTGLGLSYYLIFTGLARENKEQLKVAHRNTGPKIEGDH